MARKIDFDTNPIRAARMIRLGRAIAAARHAAHLSQPQAAAQLGIPLWTLRSWEIGRRAAPVGQRRRIAELWGGDPEALKTAAEICPTCGRPFEIEANSTRPRPKPKRKRKSS